MPSDLLLPRPYFFRQASEGGDYSQLRYNH